MDDKGAPEIVAWVLDGSAEVRRATYSFACPSPFAWFGDGHVVVRW